MTLAPSVSSSDLITSQPPRFIDQPHDRVVRSSHHRRMLPASQMFLIKQGLDRFRGAHPSREVFDASQGDGGASLGGISREELAHALCRFLPQTSATTYGTPQGDKRVRESIVYNYYGVSSGTPDHVVVCDGGRDALQKWYQAIGLKTGIAGEAVLTSAAPWISYGHGSYLGGLNLLSAPSFGDFKITVEGIDESIRFAHAMDYRVRAMILTSPDNPTGTYYSQHELIELIEHATHSGISFILVDLMYQLVIDSSVERYSVPAILERLSPEARSRVTFLDGLTKSAGASNVRHAHLLCGDVCLAQLIAAIASHTVLPNALGEAAALEVYGSQQPDRHPWVRRVVEPTTRSRALFRARMTGHGHRFVCDQGYYAFLHVGEWLGRGLPDSKSLTDKHGKKVTRLKDSTDFTTYLTTHYGLAVVPGVPFFQPDWIRFSLANTPDVTRGAIERLDHALASLL
jgi:aspartate aminotransferase